MKQSFRIGVSQIALSQPTGTLIGSASGVGFTVTAQAPTTLVLNDVKSALSSVATQVILAFLGQDLVNGGYTITQSTSACAAVTPTAGQGLLINIPVANLSAVTNVGNCPAVAVFIKQGAANYVLAEFAYLAGSTDFNHMVVANPLQSAPSGFTAASLTSGASNTIWGSRLAGGWTFTTLSPTTGGVTVNRDVSTVSVSPDTAGDFNIAVTRTASIEFSLLPNDVINVVQGNAGNFVQYTASNGNVIQEAQMSLFTAAALILGNNPMTMLMPPDSNGIQEVRLYLGQLLQNQTSNTEAWVKTATTPIKYTLSAAPIDLLINSEHTEVVYKQGVGTTI
jgi:hypothetical protein